jgi:hypothetical protein
MWGYAFNWAEFGMPSWREWEIIDHHRHGIFERTFLGKEMLLSKE